MPTESQPPDPHKIGPDLLPTPFSAEEIRLGCPAGRTIRLRVESAGGPDVIRTSWYVRVDRDGAEIEHTTYTANGEHLGEPRSAWSTWRQLQEHAAFPAAVTTVTEDELTIPLGLLPCRLYTMTDGTTVHRFWFSDAHPGMPVRYSIEDSGTVVSRVTMEADDLPDSHRP